MKVNQLSTKGFTLVELAIVLVIMGLLAGAFLGGRHLIDQAGLKTVMTDMADYNRAVILFQDTYSYHPGDMADAYEYWGTDCAATEGACNGNGDGRIEETDDYQAANHLMLASMIGGGNYAGTSGGDPEYKIGHNVIASSYRGGFRITYATVHSRAGNVIIWGGESGGKLKGSVISPVQARLLDMKADDGKPTAGRVMSLEGNGESAGDCVSSGAYATTEEYRCSMTLFLEE